VAAALAAAGHRTGLFHSGRFAYLGMDAVVRGRGLQTLADAATIPSRFTSSFGVDDRATVAALLRWIDQTPPPFFAVYMPIAGHHPYHAPGDAPRPFPERSERDEHRNDLFTSDAAFGLLRAGLRARGLDQRTLYVIAGDHGEAFGEHPGNVAHALFLYQENVHVPLLVAAPGLLAPRRVPQVVSALDLGATTADLLGLPHAGHSALDPRPRVARFATDQAMRRWGLVDGDLKVLHDQTGRVQAFDLASDPGERRDQGPAAAAPYASCF
jgi:arylsulfatase A-like enzyme